MDLQTSIKNYFESDKAISASNNLRIQLLNQAGFKQMARCLELAEEDNKKANEELILELQRIYTV